MRDQDRLTQLEIKASFLEDQVEQLDAVVARQQQQIDLLARELQRRFKCFRTVVDPGKQMTMKIDHAGLDEYPLL